MRSEQQSEGAPVEPTASGCDVQGRQCILCAGLVGEGLQALRALSRRCSLRCGDNMLEKAGAEPFCANVVSGILRVVRPTGGVSQTVGIVLPGEIVGSVEGSGPQDALIAVTDVEVCIYARADLERASKQHPGIRRVLLQSGFKALAEARRWMLVLGRRGAKERVAAFLVEMAGRLPTMKTDQNILDLGMTRGRIGELLGLSLETISRQLHSLANAELIALPHRRHVRLVNRTGLEKVAGLAFRTTAGAVA